VRGGANNTARRHGRVPLTWCEPALPACLPAPLIPMVHWLLCQLLLLSHSEAAAMVLLLARRQAGVLVDSLSLDFSSTFSIITSSGLCTRRQDTAMLTAVSCLSPVIIHTRMLASSSVWMAAGTPSCSAQAAGGGAQAATAQL
jgi:hypothetical protein